MFATSIDVLVVDDDPDVLAVSKLVMRNFTAFGVPINVHTATSKADAIAQLTTTLALPLPGQSLAGVMIIDVVMETDQAGLELCQYVREEMDNKMSQIYIRTGQPGVAPEREVIERYDISGYFTKVEATEDKLYTMIKAGIRQAFLTGYALGNMDALYALITAARSWQGMAQVLEQFVAAVQYDAQGRKRAFSFDLCYISEGQVIAGAWGGDEGAALRRTEELSARPGTALNGGGARFWVEGTDFLIEVAEGPTNAQMAFLATDTVPPTDIDMLVQHRLLRAFAALWKQAA